MERGYYTAEGRYIYMRTYPSNDTKDAAEVYYNKSSKVQARNENTHRDQTTTISEIHTGSNTSGGCH